MSYSSHSVDQLGLPFLLSDEIIFLIPKAGKLPIKVHHVKILLILSGEVEFEIEGLDGRKLLKSGDILAAPLVNRHIYFNQDIHQAQPLHVLRLFFELPQGQAPGPEMDFSDFIRHHLKRVYHLQDAIDTRLHSLIREFREESEQRLPGFRHRMRAICMNLTIEVCRKFQPIHLGLPPSDQDPAIQIVVAAKEYIEKHYQNSLTLGEIAWHVGKGEEHLARLFKRHTGQSVFDTVREVRVDAAKTLLPDPAHNLTQIAESCGFNSLAFFSRTFKQVTGMPPSQYRAHTLHAQPF